MGTDELSGRGALVTGAASGLGTPAHRMLPPSDVARMVLTMVTMPDTSFVPEVVVVPRNEPDFPR